MTFRTCRAAHQDADARDARWRGSRPGSRAFRGISRLRAAPASLRPAAYNTADLRSAIGLRTSWGGDGRRWCQGYALLCVLGILVGDGLSTTSKEP
jgi:hypothetical protein